MRHRLGGIKDLAATNADHQLAALGLDDLYQTVDLVFGAFAVEVIEHQLKILALEAAFHRLAYTLVAGCGDQHQRLFAIALRVLVEFFHFTCAV